MLRIVVLDQLAREAIELLDDAEGIRYDVRLGLSGRALRECLAKYDGAICRSETRITAESLAEASRLKAIVRAGVGIDNIDIPAASRRGIVVMNTPDGNTLSAAEHTLALILAMSRHLYPAYRSLIEGRWERKRYVGTLLAGKTIGIVGVGRIGKEVARLAKQFGMRVLGTDPYLSIERASELHIERMESIDEMLPLIDYLTVHTPLNNDTRNMISHRAIKLMRPGVKLINCARGEIFDELALIQGLESGKIGGVAIDVFEHEPCIQHPLFGVPGVLCTPHLGASTEDGQKQVGIDAVHQLIRYLTLGEATDALNIAVVDPHAALRSILSLKGQRDYVNLAYRLGLLLGQWHLDKGDKACRLSFVGQIAKGDTSILVGSFCAGLIEKAIDGATFANAEELLRERGIVTECHTYPKSETFNSMIVAEVITPERSYSAAGTTFGQEMLRLVQLGGYRLEAYLDGVLLVFTHRDVPGIIGWVGTIFGKHCVNIAQMAVGREARGCDAIGVVNLDGAPPPEALNEVLSHPDILSATVIRLPAASERPAWLSD